MVIALINILVEFKRKPYFFLIASVEKLEIKCDLEVKKKRWIA